MVADTVNIQKVYQENTDLKKADVEILQKWIKQQPHLPEVTELQLITFLHSCCYQIQATKVTIDAFFTMRTLMPDMFHLPSIEEIKQISSVGFITVLPNKTPEGYIILLTRLLDCDPNVYDFHKQVTLQDLIICLHYYQYGPNNGLVAIIDTKGLQLGHLGKISLSSVKKHLQYVQEAAPVKIRQLHYLNVNSFFEKIHALSRPFIRKDLQEMMHFHNNIKSLSSYIPIELLPEDYGGQAGSIMSLNEQNQKNIAENMEFLRFQNNQKVDETKRPGKSNTQNTMCGIEGTFKKLELD